MSNLSLPKSTDHIYLDGFPRSGNTYVVNLLKFCYPKLKFSHHLHTVAGIKLALKNGVKPIILIREPLDAVASFTIMQAYYNKGNIEDDIFINKFLTDYIDYYEFVNDNLNFLVILTFTRVKKLEDLTDFFDKNIVDFHNNKLIDELKTFHYNYEQKQTLKPSDRTSTPNEERNIKKKIVKEKISKLNNYKKAHNIYLKIINQIENK